MPANTVRVFIEGLKRLGYDEELLLAGTKARWPDISNPDGRVACTVIGEILCAAMRQKPMKNIGARLAAETPIGAFPLVDYLVITSETVGAGLKQLARYLRLSEAPYELQPREEEDPIRILFNRPLNAFAVEFGVAITVLHLRKETQGELNVLSASFSHTPEDAAEIEQILSCPIHTNASWNGFLLSRRAWQLPLRRRDPVLRNVLEEHAATIARKESEPDPIAGEVGRVLASHMADGKTRISVVAHALAMSTRSLQRRLAAAGLSYQQVLDKTRRNAAQVYLSDASLSTGEVAYLLGYSEPAAFLRAFKRWHGVTPRVFRGQLGGVFRSPAGGGA